MEGKIIILIIAMLFIVGNLSLFLDSFYTNTHIEDSIYKPRNDSYYELEEEDDDVYNNYLVE